MFGLQWVINGLSSGFPGYVPGTWIPCFCFLHTHLFDLVWFMVFHATFNNITVISWRSVLLVEETGVPGDNHRPVASH